MVRIITYAMYAQNSLFLIFLKNEKIIYSFFDIAHPCRHHSLFYIFVFRYLRRKTNNLE